MVKLLDFHSLRKFTKSLDGLFPQKNRLKHCKGKTNSFNKSNRLFLIFFLQRCMPMPKVSFNFKTKNMRFAILIFMMLYWQGMNAQHLYQYDSELSVIEGERALTMPWAGGINAAQIQSMDVTGDGEEEYVVWDINARQVRIFSGQPGEFVHLPELSHFFPSDISGFMVLVDYDGDGRKDLFTSSPFGIKAYRNTTTAGSRGPQWEVAQDFLRLESGSNLTANSLDIPLLIDIDGDGDLDILTFNFATGDYLEYYRNTSVERKGEKDIDGFASAQIRWGGFEFCGCGNISFGLTCGGQPIATAPVPGWNLRVEHAGGHSMLYADLNGDGVRDLLMGQDECSVLYFLPNRGTDEAPVFDSFENSLPGIGPLPEFPIFHAAYLVKDRLIISSHSSEPSVGPGIDFGNSVFSYDFPSTGNAPIQRFFQSDMLDLGENARPFFQGNLVNGNLVISSNRLVQGRVGGQASLYRLEGGDFRKLEQDFLGLSGKGLRELSYQQWRTAEGRDFHIVTGDIVDNNIPRKRIYWKSLASEVSDFQSTSVPGFDLRGVDHLHFFSHEGMDYMLLGRQTGELVLMQVLIAEGQMQFEVLERDFLGFTDNPVNRALSTTVFGGTVPILFAVDQRGVLFEVRGFMGSEPRREDVKILLQEGTEPVSTRLGRNSWITPIPDAFGERVDLIVGTRAGGLTYFRDLGLSHVDPGEERLRVKVYPNPTSNALTVISNADATGTLVGVNGQIIMEGLQIQKGVEQRLNLLGLSPGVYVLRLFSEQRGSTSQKILLHP
jgi:hypothetical protein